MASSPEQQADNLDILRMTVVSLVRSDTRDLTTRQLAVFLTCYLGDEGQTVRGLAAYLDIPKPSISRALDRLAGAKLVKRVPTRKTVEAYWSAKHRLGSVSFTI